MTSIQLILTNTDYNPKNNTTEYLLLRPKTKKSKRDITVDPELIKMLEKHKIEQEEMIAHFIDNYKNRGFIFANVIVIPVILF